MKLYSITAAAYSNFYGTPDDPEDRSDCTTIAQKPDCSAFLFICKDAEVRGINPRTPVSKLSCNVLCFPILISQFNCEI